MMTEACGATYCTMMEVGEAISRMMKVCGATKSTLSKVSGNLTRKMVPITGRARSFILF